MGANQLGEKFNKIHYLSMKSTQALGKIATEGVKNLSQTLASLANHVAKNIQMAAANVMTAKSPEEVWTAMKGNGSAPFSDKFKAHQESMRKVINDYAHEFSEVNDDLFENVKEGLDAFFKMACQNAPDGTEVLIKPYQSAFNSCFDSMQKIQQLMTGYLDNLEGGISQSSQKSSSASHSRK
jgi:hypothetical protein